MNPQTKHILSTTLAIIVAIPAILGIWVSFGGAIPATKNDIARLDRILIATNRTMLSIALCQNEPGCKLDEMTIARMRTQLFKFDEQEFEGRP